MLPPYARHEAAVQENILSAFALYGYERVKPPLIEFEDNLLSGIGTAMAEQTFRLMDPVSQRMMGLRADMTLQVARIAASRLYKQHRPLRLSYAGQVLRVKGTQLRPERQFGQVGAELIGDDSVAADAEVICMATEALNSIGVSDLSVDLCMPTLVPAVYKNKTISEKTAQKLRQSLDSKDIAGVRSLSKELGKSTTNIIAQMLTAAGTADDSLNALKKLKLPKPAAAELSRLMATVKAIRQLTPALTLTIDPVENRGFEYHTGVTFTLFAKGARGELGSGGRYLTGNGSDRQEAATGLTLFMDTILRAAPVQAEPNRLYLPHGTSPDVANAFRSQGWVTIAALKRAAKPEIDAKKMNCTHMLSKGAPVSLKQKKSSKKTAHKSKRKRARSQ